MKACNNALAIGDEFSLSRIDASWKGPLWRGPTQFAAIIELLDSAWVGSVQDQSFMHSLLLQGMKEVADRWVLLRLFDVQIFLPSPYHFSTPENLFL
jgi:hypothetical protein